MRKTTGKADVAIANSSGTEIGFNLIRKDGVPVYEEFTSSALVDQQADGSPEYSDFKAEEEIRLIGDNFTSGFGLEYAGYQNEANRYHYGTNIDARFSKPRLGPLSSIVYLPYQPTSVDDGGGEWATKANAYDEDLDTYAEEASVATGGWSAFITFTFASHSARYIRFYATETVNTFAQADVDAYYGAAWNNVSSADYDPSTWVTIDIGSAQTITDVRIRFQCSSGGSPGNVRLHELHTDGADSTRTVGAVTCTADFNSLKYFVVGAKLWRLGHDGDVLYFVKDFAVSPTDLYACTVAGVDYLFICLGWADEYFYMATTEVCTESTLAGTYPPYAKHLIEIAGTFYISQANNIICSTTAPLNAGSNYATNKTIGEDAYNIVDIKDYGGLVYAKKSDNRVYYIASTGTVTILINARANIAGTNTYRMFVWRDEYLIIPYGEQGLLAYDGTTIFHITPAQFMNNASDFAGQIQAVSGDDQYLYIVMDDGADVQILAAKEISTTMSWHPLRTLTIAGCQSTDISSIYKKRMWIGSSGANHLYYIPVTTKYGDIGSDTDYTYQTTGELITPFYHLNLRGDKKAWVKITLTQDHAYDADIYWECHYKKLGDSSWTDIGDFKGSSTTKITTKYLPADASSNNPVSEMMQFKLVGVTDDTAKTPILLSFDIQTIWYPAQRKLIHCLIMVEDDAPTAQGMKDLVRADTKKALLDELYNPSTPYPRAFYPLHYRVAADLIYIKALPPKKARVDKMEKDTKGDRISYIYDCWFEEVVIS